MFAGYESEIDECVQQSFTDNDLEKDNSILAADRAWSRNLNLNYHPSVTINDFVYRGSITYEDIT